MVKIANLKIEPESRGSLRLCLFLELHHTIMSKRRDLGGRTKRKEKHIEVLDGHKVTEKQKGKFQIRMCGDNGDTFIAA